MRKNKIITSSDIDKANYNFLINKPKSETNLIDFIEISVLEEKYPELVS